MTSCHVETLQGCANNSMSLPRIQKTNPEHAFAAGHVTVLLDEAVHALHPKADGIYVDGTFGGGGHSRLLLEQRPPIGLILAIDADQAAIPRSRQILSVPENEKRLRLFHTNFRELRTVVSEGAPGLVDGVLLDLGLSSFQLDEGERGFSFRFDAPLDMRFDQTSGATAADLVNHADEVELARIIWHYGEERQSRRIASAIVRERAGARIETTGHLASLIDRAVGGRRKSPIHPATRTFQALRIEVNHELDALADVLASSVDVLRPGGRLVVISFHSLEDRMVKRFIDSAAQTCVCPSDQPVCTCDTVPTLRKIGKPIRADDDEVALNPRSRSAIMRVAERLDPSGNVAAQGNSE